MVSHSVTGGRFIFLGGGGGGGGGGEVWASMGFKDMKIFCNWSRGHEFEPQLGQTLGAQSCESRTWTKKLRAHIASDG